MPSSRGAGAPPAKWPKPPALPLRSRRASSLLGKALLFGPWLGGDGTWGHCRDPGVYQPAPVWPFRGAPGERGKGSEVVNIALWLSSSHLKSSNKAEIVEQI